VVLQKPQEKTDWLPPPRTLILDFKWLIHGEVMVRKKIIHYRQLYIDRPEPIAFMTVVVDTTDHIYDDFLCLLFLHDHCEGSDLTNDIPGGIRSLSFSSR
jgi:hypothetical protein